MQPLVDKILHATPNAAPCDWIFRYLGFDRTPNWRTAMDDWRTALAKAGCDQSLAVGRQGIPQVCANVEVHAGRLRHPPRQFANVGQPVRAGRRQGAGAPLAWRHAGGIRCCLGSGLLCRLPDDARAPAARVRTAPVAQLAGAGVHGVWTGTGGRRFHQSFPLAIKKPRRVAGAWSLTEETDAYSAFISFSRLSAWSTCFMFHRM